MWRRRPSKTKKLSENKEEQLNQLKETLEAKENEIERERQVEKDEDGIVFDRDALMDKEQRLSRACSKNCRSKKRLSRRPWPLS